MSRIKGQICFLIGLGLMLLLSPATTAFGQREGDYINGARVFLQAAESGWSQAQQFCQDGDCSPDYTGLLSNLLESIIRLKQLLDNPSDLGAIQSTIANMSPVLQAVCSQMGECRVPAGVEPDLRGIDKDSISTQGRLCSLCDSHYSICENGVTRRRGDCVQKANRLLQCWRRVPFCDWPGWPFDASAYQRECQDLISAGLLPNCRCSCPQGERQGGCPQFFQTGVPCSDCSYSVCQRGGDPRCSCQQVGLTHGNWSFAQCDLCRWDNVGFSLAELRRALFCEKPYVEGIEQCRLNLMDCYNGCLQK